MLLSGHTAPVVDLTCAKRHIDRYLSCTVPCLNFYHKSGVLPSDYFCYGVTAAADNSIYLAGSRLVDSGSGRNFAVVKLDSNGELLWDWQVRFVL